MPASSRDSATHHDDVVARHRGDNIVRYYNDFAASYDERTGGRWNANIELSAVLARIGEERTPRSVLDLGAGTGQTTMAVRERFPATAVVAVDSSDGMLRQLRARLGDVTTVVDDAERYLGAAGTGST